MQQQDMVIVLVSGGGSREVHNISVRVPRFSLLGAFVVFFHGRSCGGGVPSVTLRVKHAG